MVKYDIKHQRKKRWLPLDLGAGTPRKYRMDRHGSKQIIVQLEILSGTRIVYPTASPTQQGDKW